MIRNVAVIGAGLMGSGIAKVSASYGFKVALTDVRPIAADRFQNITIKNDLKSATKDADLVIECIIEQLEAKQTLLKQIEQMVSPSCVIASNTSSLSISKLSSVLENPSRFVGLHFFNPVPAMKLVEIIPANKENKQILDSVAEFCRKIEKSPIFCADTPGFVVNKLLVPFILNAIQMAEENVASIKDIDAAMKLGARHPMGPFELADFVGLDTLALIIKGWGLECPKSLQDLVENGNYGKKTGSGFYK